MHVRRRRDAVLISVASLALGIGTTAALAAASNSSPPPWVSGSMANRPLPQQPSPLCAPPSLPGTVIDVSLTDMGAMMGSGPMMNPGMTGPGMMGGPNGQPWPDNTHPGSGGYPWPAMGMMQMAVNPHTVPAGQISLRVDNRGVVAHEAVVMPLNVNQSAGRRPIGDNGQVDETGKLGEASLTCGAGEGEGIAAGTVGWTTLTLAPGRYEVLCNIAGHYWSGMYTELDVNPTR